MDKFNAMSLPVAVNYVKITIPSGGHFDSRATELALAAQGEAVEFVETTDRIAAMKSLHLIYPVAAECIYTTASNRYLIFNHFAGPIIRDGSVVDVHVGLTTNPNEQILPEALIDMTDLLAQTYGNEQNRMCQLLNSVTKQPRARSVKIIGQAPVLALLLIQEYFEGVARRLVYQENNTVPEELIY